SFLQARLKLTDRQKEELTGLQKDTDTRLDTLLQAGQRKQLKDMRASTGGFGPPGFGPPGFGAPGGGSLFRAYRYAADYPGLQGRTLTPGRTIDELESTKGKGK